MILYRARCDVPDCGGAQYGNQGDRDDWAHKHETETGHPVWLRTETVDGSPIYPGATTVRAGEYGNMIHRTEPIDPLVKQPGPKKK